MTDDFFYEFYVFAVLLFLGWFLANAVCSLARRFKVSVPAFHIRAAILGVIALHALVNLALPTIHKTAWTLMHWNVHGLAGGLLVKAWDAYGPGIVIGAALMLLGGWLIARRARRAAQTDEAVIYGE